MGEHARAVGDERRAVRAHRAAVGDVFIVDGARFAIEARDELVRGFAGLRPLGERPFHAFDRPEEIHRRRPRRRHHVAGLLELDGELLGAFGAAALHAERDAHRRRDADGRRAADHHRANGLRHLLRRAAANVDFLAGQLALIDHDDRVALPFDCGKHPVILAVADRTAGAADRRDDGVRWAPGDWRG